MKRFLSTLLAVLVLALLMCGPVLAVENYDVTTGGATGIPANTFGPYTIEYYLDASAHNSGAGFAAGDTLDCLKFPEGAVVYGVNYEIVTGEDLATCTVDVGDSSNATGFLANQVSNSTATTNAFALTYGGTAGKSYADGGKLRLTFDHATNKLKAYIRAVVMPFKNR